MPEREEELAGRLDAVERVLGLQRPSASTSGTGDLAAEPGVIERSTQSNNCNFSGISTGGCAPGANYAAGRQGGGG